MTATLTGQSPPLPGLILPRFGTPRNLDRPTYGHEVAAIAERLGTPLMPWQRHVVDVALEYDPQTGELFYEEVVLTVPRQSGKTTLILAWMVWRMTTAAHRWGSQNATYLAQTRFAARKKLERDFARRLRIAKRSFHQITNPKARPVKATQWKLSLNNGAEHIMFGTESYLQIEAPSETASHGDTLDMPVIDEAFAQRDDSVEQAVEPATMTRTSPQLCVVSTAGNAKSKYLYLKVLAGREACKSGVHGVVCYMEWSAPEDIDFDEPGAFHSYHPAVGHTIRESRLRAKLAKARRNPEDVEEDGDDPGEDGFRRAYGNIWVQTPPLDGGGLPVVVDLKKWGSPPLLAKTPAGEITSRSIDRRVFGVAVAPDGVTSSIAMVGRNRDGLPHLEVVELQPGTWWLERRLIDLRTKWSPVAFAYHGGPAHGVAPEIHRAAGKVEVHKVAGQEYVAACAAFLMAVEADRIRHVGQAWLTAAIGGAAKHTTSAGWTWDFKAATADITPLVALTVALRIYEMATKTPAPPPATGRSEPQPANDLFRPSGRLRL
jgi:hypothetical protein